MLLGIAPGRGLPLSDAAYRWGTRPPDPPCTNRPTMFLTDRLVETGANGWGMRTNVSGALGMSMRDRAGAVR
jgi:hypothetical protein